MRYEFDSVLAYFWTAAIFLSLENYVVAVKKYFCRKKLASFMNYIIVCYFYSLRK